MRAKGRTQGRFVSLSGLKKLAPPPGSHYPLLIVDTTGLPVFFLCEWYRRQKERNPGRTAETYLDMVLPWAGFLLRHGYAWNEQPDRVRAFLVEFFREDVACLVSPDNTREDGLLIETTGASPLSKSSLGVLLAALTSLYERLIEAGYYAYQNPLRSERMTALKREHIRQMKNAGAPDHAGIRGESWRETNRAFPTNQFRQRRGKVWEPGVVMEPDIVQDRMRKAIDFMVQHATFQRDQVILLLLRQTGARLSEVLEMTAGGYRKAKHAGRALVKNKGSLGREEKTIYFTSSIERALLRYVRTERVRYDPQGRKRLEDLDDHDPLFLTRTGKAYTRSAFYHHWKKLFYHAQKQWRREEQVEFTPHDLRHLRVTRAITQIKKETQGKEDQEKKLLEGLCLLMGWRSPETMTTYTHTLNKRQALLGVMLEDEYYEETQDTLMNEEDPLPIAMKGLPASQPQQAASASRAILHTPGAGDEDDWYERER